MAKENKKEVEREVNETPVNEETPVEVNQEVKEEPQESPATEQQEAPKNVYDSGYTIAEKENVNPPAHQQKEVHPEATHSKNSFTHNDEKGTWQKTQNDTK